MKKGKEKKNSKCVHNMGRQKKEVGKRKLKFTEKGKKFIIIEISI